MNNLLRSALVLLSVLLAVPRVADAFIWKVYYNDAGRPAALQRSQVIRGIQQAIREWDQHSNGQVLVRYEGTSTLRSGPTDTLFVVWGGLSPDVCAHTCRRTLLTDCINLPRGMIELNAAMVDASGNNLNPVWSPSDGASPWRCRSLQSVLIHEFAHQFLDTGNHPANSVLSGVVPDVSFRHLWTNDMANIAYPSHAQRVRFQTISPSARTIMTTFDLAADYPPRTPIAIATGSGQGSHNYEMVWGANDASGTPGIVVARGDATTWNIQMFPRGASGATAVRSTVRRPCIVTSNSGQHQYVVWTDPYNVGEGFLDTTSGSSGAWSMESHDFGNTFSDPEAIPGLYFGDASCSLDPSLDRVVVAMQGTDEGIWISSRSALFSGPGHWNSPVRVTGFGGPDPYPATRDMPYVIFDPFNFSGPNGRLMWFENKTMTHRIATIWWSSVLSSYQMQVAPPVDRVQPVPVPFDTYEFLRGDPVMSLEGGDEVFYGTTNSATTMTAFRQWSISAMDPSSGNYSAWTFNPAPIAWVTGAASSHNNVQIGTANLMVLNPN